MAESESTQALMHTAQLEAEEPPHSSPSNISFLPWLCASIPSDLAGPLKPKHNPPPVDKKRHRELGWEQCLIL